MLNLRREQHERRQLASLDAYRAAESQARPGGRHAGGGGGSSAGGGILTGNAAGGAGGLASDTASPGGGVGGVGGAGGASGSAMTSSSRPQLPPPSLLEYEALALRVAPPEISVDNVSRPGSTVVTIDSANRPGTLVSVVEFLTVRGLDVRRARISSDGGWFYDVFEVTEAGGGKVTDERKLDDIRKMLDIEYQDDADVVLNCDETDDPRRVETTVVQLAGSDRVGLLADVTQLLTASGCDVRSAAVWTYHARVACVLSVTEKGRPLASDNFSGGDGAGAGAAGASTPTASRDGGGAKLERLRELLGEMVGAPRGLGICSIERAVRGDVRHDRRLHRLMLEEEAAAWARGEPLGRGDDDDDEGAGGGEGGDDEGEGEGDDSHGSSQVGAPEAPPLPEASCGEQKEVGVDGVGGVSGDGIGGVSGDGKSTGKERAKGASPADSASSMEAPGGGVGGANASAPPVAPPTPTPAATAASSATAVAPPPLPQRRSSPPPEKRQQQRAIRSGERRRGRSRPLVRVEPDPRTGYWVVSIRCSDRPKLLFDTLCTLADLDYDVYHASIDSYPSPGAESASSASSGGAGGARGRAGCNGSDNGSSLASDNGSSLASYSSCSNVSSCGNSCVASQEYYIRPRDGNADWDVSRAEQLVAMLEASIQRRFPRGLKVHVRSADRFGCLAALAGVLRGADLAVTRAKVRTYAAGSEGSKGSDDGSGGTFLGPSAGHTLYVMSASGGPPDRASVEAACAAVGGKLVEPGDEAASVAASGGEHAFSYSFLSKGRWGRGGRTDEASRRWPGASAVGAGARGEGGVASEAGSAVDRRSTYDHRRHAGNGRHVVLSGMSPGSSEGSF